MRGLCLKIHHIFDMTLCGEFCKSSEKNPLPPVQWIIFDKTWFKTYLRDIFLHIETPKHGEIRNAAYCDDDDIIWFLRFNLFKDAWNSKNQLTKQKKAAFIKLEDEWKLSSFYLVWINMILLSYEVFPKYFSIFINTSKTTEKRKTKNFFSLLVLMETLMKQN